MWIGHTVLTVSDVDRSADFWLGIGMREVERDAHVAVLELRGGTHLVIVPGARRRTTRRRSTSWSTISTPRTREWDDRGLDPSPIERGRDPRRVHGPRPRRLRGDGQQLPRRRRGVTLRPVVGAFVVFGSFAGAWAVAVHRRRAHASGSPTRELGAMLAVGIVLAAAVNAVGGALTDRWGSSVALDPVARRSGAPAPGGRGRTGARRVRGRRSRSRSRPAASSTS